MLASRKLTNLFLKSAHTGIGARTLPKTVRRVGASL